MQYTLYTAYMLPDQVVYIDSGSSASMPAWHIVAMQAACSQHLHHSKISHDQI